MLLEEIRERCRVLIYKRMMNHGWGLFVFCWSLLFYLECNAEDHCP